MIRLLVVIVLFRTANTFLRFLGLELAPIKAKLVT